MSAPFESDADRLALLTALGQDATYTPSGGAAKTIKVIFDHAALFNRGDGTIGERPEAEASTSDLTGTVRTGTLVVDGTTYNMHNPEPDGTGMSKVPLSEA